MSSDLLNKKKVTLITGGARSGKSQFALDLADGYLNDLCGINARTFIATAQAFDDEMADRIRRHQEERKGFAVIEEPVDLAGAIARIPEETQITVIDCLTVWLGNLMHYEKADREDNPLICAFLDAISKPPCDMVIVTNEVGLGLVPHDPMSRLFRDLAGYVNRKAAEAADDVYLVSCGIPLKLK